MSSRVALLVRAAIFVSLCYLLASSAFAQLPYPYCPQGYITVIQGGGAISNFSGDPDCDMYNVGPGYVFNIDFLSTAAWGAAVTSACNGNDYQENISYGSPFYSTTDQYMHVPGSATGGYLDDDVDDQGAIIGDFACRAGYFVLNPYIPMPGPQCPNCGDPVNPGDGNEFLKQEDFSTGDGRLSLNRSFNSTAVSATVLGSNWQSAFSAHIENTINTLRTAPSGSRYASDVFSSLSDACTLGWPQIAGSSPFPSATASFSNGSCNLSNGTALPLYSTNITDAHNSDSGYSVPLTLRRANGQLENFTCANSACTGASNLPLALSANSSGFTLIDESGNTETFDANGYLISTLAKDGYQQLYGYDNSTATLTSVSDNRGRQLGFNYTAGRLTSVTLPDGSSVSYAYDNGGRLATVTYPDSTVRTYQYTNAAFPSLITSVIDENLKTYSTLGYDSTGRTNANHLGTAANNTGIVYNANGSATVTDPLGSVRTYTYTQINGRPRIQSITGASCDNCGKAATTYDAAGYVKAETDFNNVTTCHTYDDVHGLETSRVEGVTNNAACTTPVTGVRTVQTDWNTTFRVPNERRVYNTNNVLETKTDWVYNARGQALAKCDIDPADTSGYVCSATTSPGSTAKVRRWSYTYCDSVGTGCPLVGLLKTQDGPRLDVSDVTTYAYYQTTDTSGCSTQGGTCHYLGDVQTITNALGQVTTYISYDKNDRPTRIKDVNATLTDFAYHQRGWLLTRTVRDNASGSPSANDATTTFAYDNVGNVKQVTQPDGSYLAYTYDDAHRLTDVQDNLGNKIHYTLDAAGNRTQEQTYDPGSNLKRALTRQYDQLNHLKGLLNAGSVAVQTYTNPAEAPPTGVTYTDGYDGNGNAIYSIDGTSVHVGTEQQYDPLNRLTKTLQDHAGTGPTHNTTTQYAYDTRNNLRSVIDPDNLTTSYTYDGLNNLTALGSPDTGNTGYTYDAAGNRKSQTDARSVLTSYSYDALNRLTGITYPTTSLNVTYAYDQSNATTGCSTSYPIGRLTKITDNSGTTTYCYDRRGNVLQKKQVTNSVSLTTTYTYTLSDRISSISYPSTAVVSYTRNTIGQITKITYKPTPTGTVTTLVSAVSYYPYGPLNVLTFGNGRTLTKTYDQDYAIDKVVSSVSSGLVIDATVDVLGNLANASSTVGASPPTQKYQYDPLYRLTAVQNASGTNLESFGYEATGDRVSKTLGSTQSYVYAPGTHHLTSVAGVSRSVDSNGNTTSLNSTTLTYDNRNRLTTAGAEAYNYNGKGERVSKSSPATLFTYSEGGMLLGEYSSTGAVQREYIAMYGTVVGAATGGQVYYVETDQLGTPRQVIQPGSTSANDVLMWKWDYFANNSAFGENAPSLQAITFNQRFPGQYFDAETGLNYNYFRDYDAASGRYLTSDPVGIDGGISTYSYSNSLPLVFIDPRGLFLGFGPKPNLSRDDPDISNALPIISNLLNGSCDCTNEACFPCKYKNDLLKKLATTGFSYSFEDREDNSLDKDGHFATNCAWAPLRGKLITITSSGFVKKACGCLASTIFHEMLHEVGLEHGADARDPNDPVNSIERKCDLCRNGFSR